jgi:hypothetical protein
MKIIFYRVKIEWDDRVAYGYYSSLAIAKRDFKQHHQDNIKSPWKATINGINSNLQIVKSWIKTNDKIYWSQYKKEN